MIFSSYVVFSLIFVLSWVCYLCNCSCISLFFILFCWDILFIEGCLLRLHLSQVGFVLCSFSEFCFARRSLNGLNSRSLARIVQSVCCFKNDLSGFVGVSLWVCDLVTVVFGV